MNNDTDTMSQEEIDTLKSKDTSIEKLKELAKKEADEFLALSNEEKVIKLLKMLIDSTNYVAAEVSHLRRDIAVTHTENALPIHLQNLIDLIWDIKQWEVAEMLKKLHYINGESQKMVTWIDMLTNGKLMETIIDESKKRRIKDSITKDENNYLQSVSNVTPEQKIVLRYEKECPSIEFDYYDKPFSERLEIAKMYFAEE